MRRIKSVAAVAAVMVASLAVSAAPAMADVGDRLDNRFDRIENRFDDRLDRFEDRFGVDLDDGDALFLADDFSFFGFDGLVFDDGAIVSEFDQEAVSGDVDLNAEISLVGDNSNQAAPVLQFANTGNNQDALGVVQFDSEADDFEFEGGSITFEPEFEFDSDQTIRQTAATGWGW
jgi:hypothetical protein